MLAYIYKGEFTEMFHRRNREDQFTYDALCNLYDYLEEHSKDYEVDVIGICCEWSEDTAEEIASAYGIDITDCENEDEKMEVVRAYLNTHTTVIDGCSNTLMYVAF